MSILSPVGASATDPTMQAQPVHHHRSAKNASFQDPLLSSINSPTDPASQQLKTDLLSLVGGSQDKLNAVEGQMQTAIQNAIQNSAGNPQGVHAAIESAIDSTLQQNNIDPTAFRNAFHRFHASQQTYNQNGAAVDPMSAQATAPAAAAQSGDVDNDGDSH